MSEMAEFKPRALGCVSRPPLGDLVVRLAQPADAAGIAAISAAREGLDPVAIEPRIASELGLPMFGDRLGVWVATVAGETVGYGRAHWDDRAEGTGPRAVPTGWYLMGVVIKPEWRRRGIARSLLVTRLAWLAERADLAYSVTSERNRASQALLESAGFDLVRRDVTHPRVVFHKGVGLLLSVALPGD